MKQNMVRLLQRVQNQFNEMALGQKVIAIIGVLALALAGFWVFRWTSTPTYAPLYSNLASADAASIVEKLEADGVPYKLEAGGNTITVPRDRVYETRISMSGEGLPNSSDSGYSLLDEQSLSTSQFQEQTSFKRAMEGELAKTIKAIDGIQAAVVHLAMPAKRVFASEQDPTTASVLVKTAAGKDLDDGQVQAIVHLVASSVDGLDPDKVTVADASGTVLSAPADSPAAQAGTRDKQVQAFQDRSAASVQQMLDQVLGAGNSRTTVTANLNFDKSTTHRIDYDRDENDGALSESITEERYNGAGAPTDGGVVGPDGALTPGQNQAGEQNDYSKDVITRDNAVDKTEQTTEAAPGAVESLHVGVVVDTTALGGIELEEVEELVSSSLGVDAERGDTVKISAMPFDKTAAEELANELAAAEEAEKKAKQMELIRNGAIAGAVLLVALIVLWARRRRNKARAAARDYMVDTLRAQAQTPPAPEPVPAAVVAMEEADEDLTRDMREEIAAMVDKQPEEVAHLLRTWLSESGS